MRTRTLLVVGFVALMGLMVATRGNACVRCKADLTCDKYGQDCIFSEYCAAMASPRTGVSYCYFDGWGTCYESDTNCIWAMNRPAFTPATALPELLGVRRGCTAFELRIG